MNPAAHDDRLLDLLDGLREGDLAAADAAELHDRVCNDPVAAELYVHYVQLWSELRWQHGADDAQPRPAAHAAPARRLPRILARLAAAAVIVLALTAAVAFLVQQSSHRIAANRPAVATLIDTRDAVFEASDVPVTVGSQLPGGTLRLKSGSAELEFLSGAHLRVTGPAELGLNSPMRANLRHGEVTAYVPPQARGFTVGAPGCAVVDLGTRFTLRTAKDGASTLNVLEGKVELYSTAAGQPRTVRRITADQGLTISPAGDVGPIVPMPRLRRSVVLDFAAPAGSIRDAAGRPTGFTSRLPGTGTTVAENDPGLRLQTDAGALEMSSSLTDLNGQFGVNEAQCPGVRLRDLGFTGQEDFLATATFVNLPDSRDISQFGLYVGVSSTQLTRAGVLAFPRRAFAANTVGRDDSGQVFKTPVVAPGVDHTVTVTIRRVGGKWALRVGDVDVTPPQPQFLNGDADLVVGVFAHHSKQTARFTVQLRRFSVQLLDGEAEPTAHPVLKGERP